MSPIKLPTPTTVNLMQQLGMINTYQDKWLNANVIVELLHHHYKTPTASVTAKYINTIYSSKQYESVNRQTVTNDYNLYRHKNQVKNCPYKSNQYWYFFPSNRNKLPPAFNNYSTSVVKALEDILRPSTRSITQSFAATTSILPSISLAAEQTVTTTKRKSCDEPNDPNVSNHENSIESISSLYNQTFDLFEAPESRGVFGLKKLKKEEESEVDVREVIQVQIKKLRTAWLVSDGWRDIVDDGDVHNNMTHHDIFMLVTKAKYLSIFLQLILEKYNRNLDELAQEAISMVSQFESYDYEESIINRTYHYKTILDWYRLFKKEHVFRNPYLIRTSRKGLPKMLDANPDLMNAFIAYGKENLQALSAEMMHTWLHDVAIPELIKQRKREIFGEEIVIQVTDDDRLHLLKENSMSKLCLNTVYSWLSVCGFNYVARKKSYYTDNHEKHENVIYRLKFITQYIAFEYRTHRWVHFTEQQLNELLDTNAIQVSRETAYKSQVDDGSYLYEFHVDDDEYFHDMVNRDPEIYPYGGHLSLRKPPGTKPLIILGQDESIFKQFQMTKKAWSGPGGSTAPVPKDDGAGIMISALVSREFGYGYPELTPAKMAIVNRYRKGKKYVCESAALIKTGMIEKNDLTDNPFVRWLEYGASKDGYWDYNHMAIQLDDCLDVLEALHPDFDVIFLLDHSNGHDLIRPDGLNANKIRKYFGGKQPKMIDTNIKDETYLGPFDRTIQVGDIQTMSFSITDDGPFYFQPEEKIQ